MHVFKFKLFLILIITWTNANAQCEVFDMKLDDGTEIKYHNHEIIEKKSNEKSLTGSVVAISLFKYVAGELSGEFGLTIKVGYINYSGVIPREIVLYFPNYKNHKIKAELIETLEEGGYKLYFILTSDIIQTIKSNNLLIIEMNDYKEGTTRDVNIKYSKILMDQYKCLE